MSKADKGGKLEILVIQDAEHFDALLEESEKKLILVDIHQDWCGVCDALHPTLSRVMQDYDQSSDRITICSASIGKLGDHIQKVLPNENAVHLDKNGCLPVFALFRYKTCSSIITGVDAPSLLTAIGTNMPDKPAPVIAVAAE